MKYALGNMLNGAGSINPDGLALDLQFAADKTLTARRGPTPSFSRGSTGTFVGSNGLIQSAAINAPRFDHDPVTLASRGLLIEEQRQNLNLYSDDFGNAYWSKFQSSISTNVTTSPDGTTNADKLIEDTSNNFHSVFVNSAFTVTSGQAYSRSVYAKADGRNWISLLIIDSTTQYRAFFDLQNGVVGNVSSGISATITNAGNGWWRCQIIRTASTTSLSSMAVELATANGTSSYAGNGTSGAFVWGAQLEAGSFATSYIPTTTSALTRSADVCSITGGDFTNLWNNPAGTLISEAMIANLTGLNRGILQIDNDANVHYLRTVYDSNFKSMVRANDAQTTLINTTGAASITQKIGLSYEGTSFASCINGGAISPATRTMPVGLVTMRIGSLFSGFYLSGHISAIRYYKKRLPNAKLQALTV